MGHLKKCENGNQSMQYYQIIIKNLTILHNTTQYFSILLFYQTILHNTTQSYNVSPVQNSLAFFQAKHPPHFLAGHCSFSWQNIWENRTCVFRKWKDCKGFLCFTKRKQTAVQLLVMQNSIYLVLAQNILSSNSEDMNTFAACFWLGLGTSIWIGVTNAPH